MNIGDCCRPSESDLCSSVHLATRPLTHHRRMDALNGPYIYSFPAKLLHQPQPYFLNSCQPISMNLDLSCLYSSLQVLTCLFTTATWALEHGGTRPRGSCMRSWRQRADESHGSRWIRMRQWVERRRRGCGRDKMWRKSWNNRIL